MNDQNDLNSSLSGLPPELIALMYEDNIDNVDMETVSRYFTSIEKAEVSTNNNKADNKTEETKKIEQYINLSNNTIYHKLWYL